MTGETRAVIPVRCPYCQSEEVSTGGKTDTGNQRSRGHHPACSQHSFVRDSAYQGRSPQIKPQVIEMRRNGSGVRDTARVLGRSPTTGMTKWKQQELCSPPCTLLEARVCSRATARSSSSG